MRGLRICKNRSIDFDRTQGPTCDLLPRAGQNVTADVGNNSSVDVTYKFDALGRRVFRDNGTTATIYVQAGQQTIADYTASSAPSSPTYRYVYASYIDEPVLRFKPSGSESLYYHRNQQYSVVALTNSSAAIVERYAYSAYGLPTITNASGTLLPVGSVDNRYLYTGREWDQTLSLYHYRARMYDANLGRFASRDPIGYTAGVSLYKTYFLLNKLDPSGNLQTKIESSPESSDSLSQSEKDFFKKNCSCSYGRTLEEFEKAGDAGGVVYCEEGELKIWLNPDVKAVDPKNPGTPVPYEKRVRSINDACTKKHEGYHIKQYNFLCPDICKDAKGRRCLGVKDATAIDGRITCTQFAECWGNYAELQCILRSYNDEKNNPGFSANEKDQISQLIAQKILNLLHYSCNVGKLNIPPELDPTRYLPKPQPPRN